MALEIKSGLVSRSHSGLRLFQNHWPDARTWIIGEGGLSLAEFCEPGWKNCFTEQAKQDVDVVFGMEEAGEIRDYLESSLQRAMAEATAN